MRRVIDFVDSLITPSVEPPVTVDYAKRHLRSLSNREDDLVLGWILTAGEALERETGRQLITATRELWLDRFPDYLASPWTTDGIITGTRIVLPHPPLLSVVSVCYIDAAGALVPFSDGASPETLSYQTKAPAGPYAERGWIEPLYGMTWPIARAESGAVRIQYRCGYGATSDDIPNVARQLICWAVACFDQHRGPGEKVYADMPIGVQMMFDEFKYSAFPGGALR